MTGADTLRMAGEALYGPRFTSDLAHALGMDPRNMRRLLAGSHEPSPSLLEEVWQLLEDRRAPLTEAQAALGRAIAERK